MHIEDPQLIIKKTNDVLKASQLNATLISIKQLTIAAPVLFVKVYESLFGKLNGINYSPAREEDHINNISLVLKSLYQLFPDESLRQTCAHDIICGDNVALAAVVNAFHCYTQSGKDEQNGIFSDSNVDLNRKLYTTKRQDLIPGELRTLVDRVTYLEGKLHEVNAETHSNTTNNRRSGSPNKGDQRRNHSNNVTPKKKRSKSARKSPTKAYEIGLPSQRFDSDHLRRVGRTYPSESDTGGDKGRKEMAHSKSTPNLRPTSAPLGRGRQQASDMRVAFGRCVGERTPDDSPPAQPYRDNGLYTYDTWSGRRVLTCDLERIQMRRRKQFLDTTEPKKGPSVSKGHSASRLTITEAEFPGHRTEQSVEQFNSKMKSFREPTVKDPWDFLAAARVLNSYRYMSPQDILISVEHCHSCGSHPLSLWHDEGEYIQHATDILRHLTMVAHTYSPCARVGVIMFPASIGPQPTPNAPSRIGALEVQVAYKSTSQQVIPELLHSKLKTRRWPSKSVLEKRMTAFLTQQNDIQTYSNDTGNTYSGEAEEGIAPYPVGIGPWEEVPLACNTWRYELPPVPKATKRSLADAIQWAFDSRSYGHFPKYTSGTRVRIHSLNNPWGGVEKYSLSGVIKDSYKDISSNMNMVKVCLQYYENADSCVICAESSCIRLNDMDEHAAPTELECVENGMPKALHSILCYCIEEALTPWQQLEDMDRVDIDSKQITHYHICRSSFYRQIRELVWCGIRARPGENDTMQDCTNPDEHVDVQLAYSEPALEWVFVRYGVLADISDLLELAASIVQNRNQPVEEDKDIVTDVPRTNGDTEKNVGDFQEPKDEELLTTRSQKDQEREEILMSISHAVHEDDNYDTVIRSTSASDIAVSLRSKIQQVCLSLAPPQEDTGVDGGETIQNSKYRLGAKKLFDLFDVGQTGELDMNEFNNALCKFEVECDDEELQKLWATLDTDGNTHISLPELLQFLHFNTRDGYRELGEIWATIRTCRGPRDISTVEIDEQTYADLENMEKDMFEMCVAKDGVGHLISGTQFFDILEKYEVKSLLKPGDVNILIAFFGVNVSGLPVTDAVLTDSGADINVAEYMMRFDDFFSWLQPVDFVKVCKRLARFLKALENNEKGLRDNLTDLRVVQTGMHEIGSVSDCGSNTLRVKETVVTHDEIYLDDDITIKITPCTLVDSDRFTFSTTRLSTTTFQVRTECADADSNWGDDFSVVWEILQPEECLCGIPLSEIDPTGNGVISKKNFQTYVDSNGLPINASETRSLFRNFGLSDGESMTYDRFEQMIHCTRITHKFVPLIGSKSFRKKSVVNPAMGSENCEESNSETNDAIEPSEVNKIENEVDKTEGEVSKTENEVDKAEGEVSKTENGQIVRDSSTGSCVDSVTREPMQLHVTDVELDGDILALDPPPSITIVLKYLLQEISVCIDGSFRDSDNGNKRIVHNVMWSPLLLDDSALKTQANIRCDLLVDGKKKRFGRYQIAPHNLLEDASIGSGHTEFLVGKSSDGGPVTVRLTYRTQSVAPNSLFMNEHSTSTVKNEVPVPSSTSKENEMPAPAIIPSQDEETISNTNQTNQHETLKESARSNTSPTRVVSQASKLITAVQAEMLAEQQEDCEDYQEDFDVEAEKSFLEQFGLTSNDEDDLGGYDESFDD